MWLRSTLLRKHFYVEALVLLQDHQLNYLWLRYLQSKLFRTTTTVYYTTGEGEVHEQVGEAQLPRSSKPPQLPTEAERLLHELTHQPYRSWCEVANAQKADQPTTNDNLKTRKRDPDGLRVLTRPTSTTWFTTTATTDSSHNA